MRHRRLLSEPPVPVQPLIARPALTEALERRWEVPLLVLQAGSGAGKTVALAQALTANLQQPRGLDAWVSCEPEDDRPAHLADAIVDAIAEVGETRVLRRTPDLDTVSGLTSQVHDAVWALAPVPVCLVLDEVHVLRADGAGLGLVRALAERLPLNGHLLVATRPSTPLRLLRVVIDGTAVVIDPDSLTDQPDAALRGECPLPAVSADARDALALLRSVGPLDDAGARRLLADDARLGTLLKDLPFVLRSNDRYHVHERWDTLAGVADHKRRTWVVRAVELATADGSLDHGFHLAARYQEWDLAIGVVAEACRSMIYDSRHLRIGDWLRLLPAAQRSNPAVLLAEALFDEVPYWPAVRERLERSIEGLAQSDDTELELIALARLGVLSWQAGDLAVIAARMDRVHELAERGEPLAVQMVAIAQVLSAEIAGDVGQMWRGIAELGSRRLVEPFHSMTMRYRALLELLYGSPRRAVELTDRVRDEILRELRPELDVVRLWALWLSGSPDVARQLMDELLAPGADGGASGEYLLASQELMSAFLDEPRPGSHSSAQALAERARVAADEGALVRSLVLAMAAAARHVGAGEEELAADVLRSTISRTDSSVQRGLSALIRGLALPYVLLSELRQLWKDAELGEGPRNALDAGRALVAARDGDVRAAELAAAVLADPQLSRSRLPPRWLVELAVRYNDAPGGEPELAERVIEHLGSTGHQVLRKLLTGQDAVLRRGAEQLVARISKQPSARFVLRMLGPVSIERDRVPIEHPDWRRERVRAMFALLARRSEISRAELADQLWPDLDPEAAANNVRVTLSYLQRVLEPDRRSRQPPYHVRADSSSVRFAGRSSWIVDVEEFERLLDRAESADAKGELQSAIEHFRQAVSWYRGPLLPDGRMTPTEEIERDRLRSRFVVAAVRLGALLLAAGEPAEAQRLVARALEADPWYEAAAVLDVECHLGRGDRAAAIRSFQRCQSLLEQLDVPPSKEVRRVGRALGHDRKPTVHPA